jgi:putative FmdB family regulatory protein
MPTYEYRCPRGHHFERFQKISDPPEADCPSCGEPAERLISAGAGFVLKGDGFYATDYRSDSYKKAASEEAGGGDGSEGSASEKKQGGVESGKGTDGSDGSSTSSKSPPTPDKG